MLLGAGDTLAGGIPPPPLLCMKPCPKYMYHISIWLPQGSLVCHRLEDGEGEGEGETQTQGGEDEDEDIVLGQVQRSFKCPLTRKYLEDPVTSAVCKHSYSRVAILEHIRKRYDVTMM